MRLEDIVVPQESIDRFLEKRSEDKSSIKVEDIVVPESSLKKLQALKEKRAKKVAGFVTEVGEGVTLGLLGELSAALEAATTEKSYKDAKLEYEVARDQFKKENPGLASYALPAEILASIPTGIGLAKALGKAGITGVASQVGTEGFIYGAAQGDSFEERAFSGITGALAGATMGRVIDKVITPSSAGGLRTEANDLADDALNVDDVASIKAIEEAKANEKFTEVDNPVYARTPLSEAQTAGELYEGVKGAFGRFYNDKVTGVSDELMRDVSPQVGARYQKADETALRTTNKELGDLSERLIPVIKIINDSVQAKGALLDYAAGKIGKKGTTREEAVALLEKELASDLNTEHMNTLKAYLNYSFRKNQQLNKKVFGGDYKESRTYLHTRNNANANRFKEEGLEGVELEDRIFKDSAQERLTRGSYLNKEYNAPNPLDYDNPIVSDMQRVFKMERLAQLQKEFGVDITVPIPPRAPVAEGVLQPTPFVPKGMPTPILSPEGFMNAFKESLISKGLSVDGADYAKRKITDAIMGQQSAPHPLIQAANSGAYATTLAGPMSAILNIADIPLVGAKYGGRAVLEGMQVLNPFKKIPSPDLKKLGLNDQNFGEFVNRTNELANEGRGFMANTATAMRKGTDFLMKGSGFATMDQVGKKGVMRGVLRSAADDAQAGRLADNWGFYFNDAELKIIESQLKKHGVDWREYTGKGKELIEQLMFAGLGQQQLISAAGRPAAWARNPNLRPLWALRGFVVKQQALALREVMGNIKAGKPEKAAEFLGRYAAYGAGGYAVINEGRQFIFGDGEMSFNGLARGYGDAWASLLTANTLGLNDYQYGQIKQIGFLPTMALGMEPIITSRARDIATTMINVLDGKRPPQALATEFPIIKQPLRLLERASGGLGLLEVEEFAEEGLRTLNPQD
jgi:hypothetical protein